MLDRGTALCDRELYLAPFPGSAQTFALGDFHLYELAFERGRLIGGFGRARTVTAQILAGLAS